MIAKPGKSSLFAYQSIISIMHVSHSFDIGGLENGVVNLINKMDRRRFSHSVCCIGRSGKSAERITRQDVEIVEMKKSEGRELLLPIKLARVFRSKNVDIVHTRNWGAVDGIVGARLAGIPVVIHGEHGRDMSDLDGSNRKRNMARKGLNYFVDRFITVSEDLRQWLIMVGIDKKKIQRICNGVDTESFSTDGQKPAREDYGYHDQDFIIGTIGRLDPVKNQQMLIKVFAVLKHKYNNLKLLIVGDGECRTDLERMACNAGHSDRIRFMDMLPNVPDILKLMDIFVLPSLREGISNTILEAMACGVPVVATRVGGSPELIVNGETGRLVPAGDAEALAEAIESYILNRAYLKANGSAARQRAVREFAVDSMIRQYEMMYLDLLKKKNVT